MNRYYILGVWFLAVLIYTISTPQVLHAETHVKNEDLYRGAVWKLEGSPYILDEDIRISDGYTLGIEPGVIVTSASSSDQNLGPYALTFDSASLFVEGNSDLSVYIRGLYGIYFENSSSNIENAVIDNTFLNFNKSTSTISRTILKNATWGINAKGSHIAIDNSKIINNTYGINSNKSIVGPFLMFDDYKNGTASKDGIGGMGNVFEDMAGTIIDSMQNVISIKNSEINGNTRYGIYNRTVNPISAEDNWWGDPAGPKIDEYSSGGGDIVFGPVNYLPWKKSAISEVICCSNVLFLPGIEASRLYKDSRQYLGTTTDQLWEPYGNTDVKKLALDSSGNSLDPNVYTKDILNSAFGLKDIYKSFIVMMNDVVADKIINQWIPFPYDWRMSTRDIAIGSTKLSSTSISLIDTIEDLAKSSKTGKVIIVTHSNGGLVAKALMQGLVARGEAELIEKIINVAVPELGTPKAILSMLHGYGQSLAGGIIVSEKNARNLSQNMLGAYGLLPSRKFFEMNPIKVISDSYSSSSELVANTYESMRNFILFGSFSKNSSSNTDIPLLLNQSLLTKSDSLHSSIDYWRPASTTKTLSIFGWGLPTTNGVVYEKDAHCKDNSDCDVSYLPSITNNGDGTVLTKSSADMSDRSLFINLKTLKKDTKKEINHANILESPVSLGLIRGEITNSSTTNNYNDYTTNSEPIDNDRWLTIKIFSPVDIDIYDKEGNHTGKIDDYNPEKDSSAYENNIPMSYYEEFSGKKLVRLLYGDEYKIILTGNDAGSVIVKADVQQFDKIIASTTFSEIPVTKLMNTELIISTSTNTFSTSSMMIIDIDGDGTTDYINHSNEFLQSTSSDPISDYNTYIECIRKVIFALGLESKDEKKWLDRINKIGDSFQKKHYRAAEKFIKKLSDKQFKKKILTKEQKETIFSIFEEMLDSLELNDR